MKNTPKLRFKEFSGEWEIKQLGELSNIQRGASPRPIADPKWFDKNSKIGWVRISDVTSSNMYLEKVTQYLSDEGVKKSRLLEEPHLILSIAASVGKPIINKIPVCIHDGFIVFNDLDLDLKFGYYFLSAAQEKWERYKQPGTQFNLNSDLVSIMDIGIPSKSEQEKISDFFLVIDKKIEKQQEKIETLEEYKKGTMQKIFSQEIRFKDENGKEYPKWEEKKLGKYIVEYKEKTSVSDQYPALTSSRKGLFLQSDYFDKQIASTDNTGYNIVPRGYFTYRHMSDDAIFYFNINTLVDFGIVSTLYPVFTTNDKLDSNFLMYYLNEGDEFKKYALLQKQGGSRTYMYLSKLKEFEIKVPSIGEQLKITKMVDNLQKKSEKEKEKLEQLKEWKKGLLQQMFV